MITLKNQNKRERPRKKVRNNVSRNLDWQDWKKGWQYKGDIDDPQYLKDRDKLFKENGNGWWWYEGVRLWKENQEINEIKRKRGGRKTH